MNNTSYGNRFCLHPIDRQQAPLGWFILASPAESRLEAVPTNQNHILSKKYFDF